MGPRPLFIWNNALFRPTRRAPRERSSARRASAPFIFSFAGQCHAAWSLQTAGRFPSCDARFFGRGQPPLHPVFSRHDAFVHGNSRHGANPVGALHHISRCHGGRGYPSACSARSHGPPYPMAGPVTIRASCQRTSNPRLSEEVPVFHTVHFAAHTSSQPFAPSPARRAAITFWGYLHFPEPAFCSASRAAISRAPLRVRDVIERARCPVHRRWVPRSPGFRTFCPSINLVTPQVFLDKAVESPPHSNRVDALCAQDIILA